LKKKQTEVDFALNTPKGLLTLQAKEDYQKTLTHQNSRVASSQRSRSSNTNLLSSKRGSKKSKDEKSKKDKKEKKEKKEEK
jgi:hypothetical protein